MIYNSLVRLYFKGSAIALRFIKENFKYLLLLFFSAALVVFLLARFDTIMLLLSKLLSVLTPLIAGFCIAFVVNELLKPLERLWLRLFSDNKAKRPVCIAVSMLIVLGAISAVCFIIIPETAKTVSGIISSIPAYVKKTEVWANSLSDFLERHSLEIPQLDIDYDKIAKTLTDFFTAQGSTIVNSTVKFTTSVVSTVVNIFLSAVFAVYMLSKKEKLCSQIERLARATLPQRAFNTLYKVTKLTNTTFSGFVSGQVLEAFILAMLCFIGMLIFRMPYAATVSTLVCATALIPIFGAFIGTVVGAFLILFISPVKALWFIIFITVLQQIEGNLIYPRVVGKSVGLPGLWVLTAITVGGGAFGLLGILLSVPVFSVIYALLREFVNKRLAEKAENEEIIDKVL